QFGDGTYNSSTTPRYAYLFLTSPEPAVGLSHVCYSSDVDNRSYCAGSNASGQLGIIGGSSPWFVWNYASQVKSASAGENFTCWLTDRGYVTCTGRNNFGQLGQPSFSDSTIPLPVHSLNVPIWTFWP